MQDNFEYTPKLTDKEIEGNHKQFSERVFLYQKKGLNFVKSREFLLKKIHPIHGSILEIGTGTGYTALTLAKAGYKFISIDKDKEALKIAALNLAYANVLSKAKLCLMDGKSMNFESGSFRNVICMNLFHHIDAINKMLSEIDRVVCANGKIIISDFNEKGMRIVDAVHKKERRVHKNSNVAKNDIYAYFRYLGYEIKDYEDKCHWLLICHKLIKQ